MRRGSSLSAKRKEHKYDFICTGTATGGHKSDFICSKRKTKKSLFGNLPTDIVQDMTNWGKGGKPKCFTLSFSIDEILSWYLGNIVTCWYLCTHVKQMSKCNRSQWMTCTNVWSLLHGFRDVILLENKKCIFSKLQVISCPLTPYQALISMLIYMSY